ncbi:MAG: hypothetical protein COW65_13975 [Cytophagales bacterium CG18_big_fil_WC_8_21_14_2_50_42_9]|nr:MAG: hypothetical protein COW65_13975 [Cytophagales bacterium CG18_big_fil_WC_8_21_14_2_50_42_9]
MKIYFKPEGGFGFFPGLNKPLELNSETLPAEEASHLRNLVNEARFFTLPNQNEQPVRGADMKHYTIKVEDKDQEHWVQISDTEVNPPLQNLVNYLNNKQKKVGVK